MHSDERFAFEQTQRTKSQERVRKKLEALERRVASGKLKALEKIGAAAKASAGLDLSATEALAALKSLRVVDIALADGTTKQCVTRPTQRVASILRALEISDNKPPTPPPQDHTVL